MSLCAKILYYYYDIYYWYNDSVNETEGMDISLLPQQIWEKMQSMNGRTFPIYFSVDPPKWYNV